MVAIQTEELNPEQILVNKQLPLDVIDITDPSPLDFEEDPSIPITATVLSLGLLARASRLAYTVRFDVPAATWDESQKTLFDLMQHVRDAGWEAHVAPELIDRSFTPVFVGAYNALHAQSNLESHNLFIDKIDSFLEQQRAFLDDPRSVLHENISGVLRPFTGFLRQASESYFVSRFGPAYLESQVVIPDTLVDHDLLREFTDQEYWRHSAIEMPGNRDFGWGHRAVARIGVITMHQMLTDDRPDIELDHEPDIQEMAAV